MKIKIVKEKWDTVCWLYNTNESCYIQKQFDYIYKHLCFDKLNKNEIIYFNNEEIKELFKRKYIENIWLLWLNDIYKISPLGYKWLQNNWGKGEFKTVVRYTDKQELKIVINKLINVELIRSK